MSEGIACMWMRGGTSKGAFFVAQDLPVDTEARDTLLLRIMGSPDMRQIDGMGGADPLTSKVAIVSKSMRADMDVNYLFLQVFVDQALVSDAQNCGNMLAGVGPFAIERGLVAACDNITPVTIWMENTGQSAIARIETPSGKVRYEGGNRIDGVPGTAAPIPIIFADTAGSSCGALLPSGNVCDTILGVDVTFIDNGMPCVVLRAHDVGATGTETREELDQNEALKAKIEAIRLVAGPLMNLGDVADKSVPKMMMVSPPQNGGAISVRSFIPKRAHASIGVLGAVSVATACLLKGSVAFDISVTKAGTTKAMSIEHPTGEMTCVLRQNAHGEIVEAALLRTARKLMDGVVFP